MQKEIILKPTNIATLIHIMWRISVVENKQLSYYEIEKLEKFAILKFDSFIISLFISVYKFRIFMFL